MFSFWRRARNQTYPGSGKHAAPDVPVVFPSVPVVDMEFPVLFLPNRDDTLEDWEPPSEQAKHVKMPDHIRIVVSGLQECGRTGYVPGMTIHRVYPELAWIANVVPLTRRQLDLALSANLQKSKRRTPGGVPCAHYYIPERETPENCRKPNKPEFPDSSTIVAFASRSGTNTDRARILARKPQGRQKGAVKAAA